MSDSSTMKNFMFIFICFLIRYSEGQRKKVVFTEQAIMSVNSSSKGIRKIKNPDFYGTLPNQVFIMVGMFLTLMYLWSIVGCFPFLNF